MTDEDFHRIEAALGIKLTAAYRGVMNPYSFDRNSPAALFEIPDNPSMVINLNKDLRAENPFGIQWPDEYFVFGSDGESIYYYLDTTEGDGPVYQANAQTKEYFQVADHLDEWAESRLPDINELDQELEIRTKKKTDETEVFTLDDDLEEAAEKSVDDLRAEKQKSAQEAEGLMTRAERQQADQEKRDRRKLPSKKWWEFWKK